MSHHHTQVPARTLEGPIGLVAASFPTSYVTSSYTYVTSSLEGPIDLVAASFPFYPFYHVYTSNMYTIIRATPCMYKLQPLKRDRDRRTGIALVIVYMLEGFFSFSFLTPYKG